MATVWTLTAVLSPGVQTPTAFLTPGTDAPNKAAAIIAGASGPGSLTTPFNTNAAHLDNLGTAGGVWAFAVVYGLELTAGSGLTLNVSAGGALVGAVPTKTAALTAALTDASQNHVWLLRSGAISLRQNVLTPPATPGVYLGRVTCAAGAITAIDYSGRVEVRGGTLYRRTADAAAPADTPPASLVLLTQTAGGLYLWDGGAYRNVTGTLAGLAAGPNNAQYLTLAAHADLTVERVLTAGDGLAGTDAGAGAAYTLAVNVDGATLETSADTLRVKDGGITAPKLATGVGARPLALNTTAVGNALTGEDDLMTYSLPGGTLSATGARVEIQAFGTFAANANVKQVKLYFGATVLYATGAVAANAGAWQLRAVVIRTGAATQIAIADVASGNALIVAGATYATPAETLSGAVTIKATGEGVSNDDISQKGMIVTYYPAP